MHDDHPQRLSGLSPARRELLALWLDTDTLDETAPLVAPSTPEERALALVWEGVLDVERVGIDDDYFALGGDSIHAIVIVARVHELGWRMSALDLFEHRSIREVAKLLDSQDGQDATASMAEDGALALTPMQEGMIFHTVGGTTPGAYVVQVTCRLMGRLDRDAFRSAWQTVARSNPALRVGFHLTEGRAPTQLVSSVAEVPVDFVDSRSLTPEQQARQQETFLAEDRVAGFVLARPPLLRLTVFQLTDDLFGVVWSHHHLVLDGWSQQLVLRDVLRHYEDASRHLPVRPVQRPAFTGYVDWLERRDPAEETQFWRSRMAGLKVLTPVTTRDQSQVVSGERRTTTCRLSAGTGERLRDLCRTQGLTESTVLAACWGLVLAEVHRTEEAVFGLTVSGRPETLRGVTEMVGMFINTLPLRLSCPRDGEVRAWLADAQRQTVGLWEHQHTPLSRVEGFASRRRPVSLFDSIVVVENFPTWVGDGHETADFRIVDPEVTVDEGYPLVLELVPESSTRLLARYDSGRLHGEEVSALLGGLIGVVEEVVADDPPALSPLRARIRRALQGHVEQVRREGRRRRVEALGTTRRGVAVETHRD